ncbi:ketopantoate reductase PanE/ApbA-domain-containing protein [Phlyctochytrium arcticum]|nr:ketopantoate reductase PanE/ApbA-domain-containing protein [Phlyctochytrium arcticum]
MSIHILLVGAGAVGAFYASRLHQPNHNIYVSVVCRSNFKAVKAAGFKIQSRDFGDYEFTPHAVYQSAEDAARQSRLQGLEYDYVILATKALPDVDDEAKGIEPVVTPGKSVIVLIQNGVGIEEPHHLRFPQNPVLCAVTVISAAQVQPGLVVQHRWTRISFGQYIGHDAKASQSNRERDSRGEEAQTRLIQILKDGGVADAEGWDPVTIQLVRWHKIAINATFNPSAVLSGGCGNADMVLDPDLREHVHGCMSEVFATAQKIFNRPFPEKLASIDAIIKSTERNKGTKPSMLLDWEAGKPMELEVILGNPIRIAKRNGIEMPRLQSVYALLRMAAVRRGTQLPRVNKESSDNMRKSNL